MANQKSTGLQRIINAAGYSYSGLVATFTNEAAFRQELALALVFIPVAFWLGESGVEIVLLVTSLLLVLIIELINSAIEATIDRIGSEQHELSGRAKDIGSAAVSLALVNAGVVWLVILTIP